MQAYVPLVFAFPWRVKRLPTAFVQWDQQPFVRYAQIRTHCTSHGIREGDGQHWLRRQKQYGPSWSLGPSAIRSQGRLALLPWTAAVSAEKIVSARRAAPAAGHSACIDDDTPCTASRSHASSYAHSCCACTQTADTISGPSCPQKYVPLCERSQQLTPLAPHDPQPHPSAPEEVAKNFDNFRKILETGPHFDPAKLKPFSLESSQPKAGGSASSSAKADAVDTLFDLPPRFWNTPSMRMSPAEMDAVQVRVYLRPTNYSSPEVPVCLTRFVQKSR